MKRVSVDSLLNERFEFNNPKFSFGIWEDDFSDLLNGTLNCHSHNYFELAYLAKGQLKYYINDEEFTLRAGESIFLNKKTLHMAIDDSKSARMLVVTFSEKIFIGENSFLNEKYISSFLKKDLSGFRISENSLINRKIERLCKNDQTNGFYELQVISQLSDIWIDLLEFVKNHSSKILYLTKETKIQKEQTIKILLQYMYKNYGKKITIENLCEEANINRSECFRCFKLFTRKKPLEFVNEIRITHATKLLIETNLSINEISLVCGFLDNSYFIKVFKDEYKMTPLKYRKSNLKENKK